MLKKGLGCFLWILIGMALLTIVVSRLPMNEQEEKTTEIVQSCKLHGTSYDKDGNQMTIYVIDGKKDFDEFRRLCSKFKEDNKAQSTFRYLVLFDESKNVVTPNGIYTAGFGLSFEPLEHVLAWYEYNPANDFSELQTFPKSMADGKANKTRID